MDIHKKALKNSSATRHNNDKRSLWDKFWKDKNGHVVITQTPNIWLLIWVLFEAVSLFSGSNRVTRVSHVAAIIALGIWAGLELFKGINYFRRLIGLIFLTITIMSIFGKGI